MAELEQDLGLIQRLAQMYEGNADARLRQVDENSNEKGTPLTLRQHEMVGASSLAIAASYWSMISPSRALALYRRASIVYRAMGHSYWMVLALAAASADEIGGMASVIGGMPMATPQSIAFSMVGTALAHTEDDDARMKWLDAEWHHAGNGPVGRLGIPLDHYGNCARAMVAARRTERIDSFLTAGAAYVHRAAEVIRSASHDTFHWLRLQSSILPAEPEAVAMTTALSMMSYSIFRVPISELSNLDSHGQLLVKIGDNMRDAAFRQDLRL
jgi:hypothetical protein